MKLLMLFLNLLFSFSSGIMGMINLFTTQIFNYWKLNMTYTVFQRFAKLCKGCGSWTKGWLAEWEKHCTYSCENQTHTAFSSFWTGCCWGYQLCLSKMGTTGCYTSLYNHYENHLFAMISFFNLSFHVFMVLQRFIFVWILISYENLHRSNEILYYGSLQCLWEDQAFTKCKGM